jgi:hypothetical protein
MKSDDDLIVVNAADIEICSRYDESRWNGWRLEGDLCLVYPAYPGSHVYPIDLEGLTSSAEMLDMIIQVAGKNWATDECIAGLVHALDHILDPQAHLCSGGQSKRLTPARIRKLARPKNI